MNKKSNTQRIILISLIVVLLGSAGLIAYKLNAKNPLDSSIVNRNTKATFQKQVIIPDVPTSTPIPSPSAGPTQTLIANALTSTPGPSSSSLASTEMPTATPGIGAISTIVSPTEEVIVAESSSSATITTATAEPTTAETLLASGSYQYFFVLALAGTSVIIMSLLF